MAPKSDSALLVIIRDTYFGGAIVFWNYLDRKLIGETMGKSYFVTEVPPGPRYVISSTENTGVARFDFKPQKIYYLGQSVAMGVWRARTGGFYPMTAQEASESMKNCAYYKFNPEDANEDLDSEAFKNAVAEYEAGIKEHPEAYKALLEYDGQ
ncbi:MAG: hypothetical protein HY895_17655 [Deltaproteobacteria bacterium]|nr:hypothetical protein [Deltaproteobacteria bacterium]